MNFLFKNIDSSRQDEVQSSVKDRSGQFKKSSTFVFSDEEEEDDEDEEDVEKSSTKENRGEKEKPAVLAAPPVAPPAAPPAAVEIRGEKEKESNRVSIEYIEYICIKHVS